MHLEEARALKAELLGEPLAGHVASAAALPRVADGRAHGVAG